MNDIHDYMATLLNEKDAIDSLEQKIQEKKERVAKMALKIEEVVGTDNIGNILFDGKYYQIRKRKGSSYVCGPRDEPFGSWRKKKEEK